MDVVSADAVDRAINEIVAEFNGRLDVFVANSGIAWMDGAFIDGPVETAKKVMAVNVDGVMWCAKSAGAHFRRQKKEGTTLDGKPLDNFVAGSFIATASMSGSIVNIPQLQAVYNGSKAAVIHFCTCFDGSYQTPKHVNNADASQARAWPSSGRALRASTRFLPDTSRPRFRTLRRPRSRSSGRTRRQWGKQNPFYDCWSDANSDVQPRGPGRRAQGRLPVPGERRGVVYFGAGHDRGRRLLPAVSDSRPVVSRRCNDELR